MCSFTVLGGGLETSQYLVWPPFASRSATHLLRIELIRLWLWPVECWSTPLQWLCEVAGYWQELEHVVVYADPEHPKHAKWVTCPVSMLAMQELGCFQLPGNWCTDPCNMSVHYPCCSMRWWSWMNGTTMGLRISSRYLLCIQNAINKMHLCSLSKTYPYHNPTATMGHSIHTLNQQTAHPHDAIHAVCHLPCTVKTGIHPWREHLSKVPDAIECEHLPTQVGYDDKLQSGRDPNEDDEHADELPWDGFWQFVQKFFGYANRLLQQLSRWLVSDDLGGEDAGCGGPGLV